MGPNIDTLVYLDLDFVARKYEEIVGRDPNAKTARTEGASAGVKALFATGGVSTSETVSYSVTSRQMLGGVWDELQRCYKELESFENNKGTKLVWVSGTLTIAEWKSHDSKEPGYEFYELRCESGRVALLTNVQYFAAGFALALSASSALKGNISIPVRCLIRMLWYVEDASNYVASPYVVLECT